FVIHNVPTTFTNCVLNSVILSKGPIGLNQKQQSDNESNYKIDKKLNI
ncbi:12175_t:CDS:1, partial [Cetraspora pellucida]